MSVLQKGKFKFSTLSQNYKLMQDYIAYALPNGKDVSTRLCLKKKIINKLINAKTKENKMKNNILLTD
jgi:hypothetical protein